MRLLFDPVTWEEEMRYIFLHDVLLVAGIVAGVAVISIVLIVLLRKKKKRGKQS